MIDLVKLHERRMAFGLFARQLIYPDQPALHLTDLESMEEWGFPPAIFELLQTYYTKMRQLSPDDIQEQYVQTFDFQRTTTLYMTYAKLEDAKERGELLVKLKAIYELHGLEIASNELPDYLPLMCEFLYAADWLNAAHSPEPEGIGMLLAVLEDGTYGLMQALEKSNSPYFYIVKAIRETFKQCLRQEVVAHGHD